MESDLGDVMIRALPIAPTVFLVTFAIYNANGREIGSYDTQPTKFAAITLARHGTLRLDSVVMATPVYGERSGFSRDREGHYRSAYPVLPAILAGTVATALAAAHVVDLREPATAGLVAKLTASMLTSLAVVLSFLVARRRLAQMPAVALTFALGLGTNYWAVISQTLWQTETAVAALTGAMFFLSVPAIELNGRRLGMAALLLGMAGAARPQLAPAVAVLALSILVRRGRRADVLALVPLAAFTATAIALNVTWFGHPLGTAPRLEALHINVHGVSGSLGNPLIGLAGLLVSPSRGLLVFSPIVAIALAAWPAILRGSWRDDLRWCCTAALVELACYASYSVWWGGHTYGPRYVIDIIPLLVPLAAVGLPWCLGAPWRKTVALAALVWSILVAGTGAVVYPNDQWNTSPAEVDVNHERLWDWRDPQVVRCWKAGPSPSNFSLFKSGASL